MLNCWRGCVNTHITIKKKRDAAFNLDWQGHNIDTGHTYSGSSIQCRHYSYYKAYHATMAGTNFLSFEKQKASKFHGGSTTWIPLSKCKYKSWLLLNSEAVRKKKKSGCWLSRELPKVAKGITSLSPPYLFSLIINDGCFKLRNSAREIQFRPGPCTVCGKKSSVLKIPGLAGFLSFQKCTF